MWELKPRFVQNRYPRRHQRTNQYSRPYSRKNSTPYPKQQVNPRKLALDDVHAETNTPKQSPS